MKHPTKRNIAALAALLLLVILAPSLAVGFSEKRPDAKPKPIKILASPSILQPGTQCRIEVDDQPPTSYRTIVSSYEGTVIEADDEGVRLDVRETRRVDAVPAFSKLPYVNRMFRNVGIGRPAPGAKQPPLAISADKIRSVTVLASSTPNGAGSPKLDFVPPSP